MNDVKAKEAAKPADSVDPLVMPDDVVISAIDVYCDHGQVNKDYNKARVILDLTLPKHSRFYRRLRALKG